MFLSRRWTFHSKVWQLTGESVFFFVKKIINLYFLEPEG